uniref:NADH-ubiquinone oxidoreductase chain 6 n=1 Tax=Gyna caffrorum TaxID=2093439 RepID=A0A2P1H7E8_9NEOP|nr:NADH dehydrogenase subunit 6 [Gyna caffrorum]
MLLMMSLLSSVIFTQMNHPLAMGLILLLQTSIIAIITGTMSQAFWFSYILFLIFIGGMLVLFIYITSLASNELFSMSTKLFILTTILFPITIWLFYQVNFTLQNNETYTLYVMNSMTNFPLIKLYNLPTSIITIMLALYLFLTLIAVVKITNIFKGPLRQMN